MDHTIQGKWATRELWIDGQQVTVDMVQQKLRHHYVPPPPFAWGTSEGQPPFGVRLVIDAIHAYLDAPALREGFRLLDGFFFDELTRLSQADFTLTYSDEILQQKLDEYLDELEQDQRSERDEK